MRFTQQNIHYILLVYKYVLQYSLGSDSIPFSSLNNQFRATLYCIRLFFTVVLYQLNILRISQRAIKKRERGREREEDRYVEENAKIEKYIERKGNRKQEVGEKNITCY